MNFCKLLPIFVTLTMFSHQGYSSPIEVSSSSSQESQMMKRSSICAPYTGQGHVKEVTAIVGDTKFTEDGTTTRSIQALVGPQGQQASIYVGIEDHHITMTFKNPLGSTDLASKYMINFKYKNGMPVSNIGQNGWYIEAGHDVTCTTSFPHTLGAIDSVHISTT